MSEPNPWHNHVAQQNLREVPVGSTEFQHDAKSSLLRNKIIKKDIPACIMKNNMILQVFTKKSEIKKGAQIPVLDFFNELHTVFLCFFFTFL